MCYFQEQKSDLFMHYILIMAQVGNQTCWLLWPNLGSVEMQA